MWRGKWKSVRASLRLCDSKATESAARDTPQHPTGNSTHTHTRICLLPNPSPLGPLLPSPLSTSSSPPSPTWRLQQQRHSFPEKSLLTSSTSCPSPCLFQLLAFSPSSFSAQHGAPISSVSFLPGKGTSQLLTADRRGRAVLHTFSSMLLRTSTASRVVLDGQYGPLLGVAHLAPFLMAPQAAAGGGGSSGGGAGGGAGGVGGGAGPGSPMVGAGGGGRLVGDDAAARRAFFEVRGVAVGRLRGVCELTGGFGMVSVAALAVAESPVQLDLQGVVLGLIVL